jgi:hypothetical protein
MGNNEFLIGEERTQRLKQLLTNEVFEVFFQEIQEIKQRHIYELPDETIRAWNHIFWELFKLNKRYTALENQLLLNNIPLDQRIEAETNLRGMEKTRASLEEKEKNIFTPAYKSTNGSANDNLIYDRTARPGVISIRPTLKS